MSEQVLMKLFDKYPDLDEQQILMKYRAVMMSMKHVSSEMAGVAGNAPGMAAIDVTGVASGEADKKYDFFMDPKKALTKGQPEKIYCAICGFEGKSLARHIKTEHGLEKKEYIAICGYPSGTSLNCKDSTDKRREVAERVKPYEKSPQYKKSQEAAAGDKPKGKASKKEEASE